nr:MAG TPA: hypothetical protein [Caudoviricetes sp.]
MISISRMKQTVKDIVEEVTGVKAFYDVVPNNVRTGALIVREATEFAGRTIDGEAHVAHHSFEVFIFSFVSAEESEELTDSLVSATDGKYSGEFRLIMVNSITPTKYDLEAGFWANAVSMEFVER